MLGKTTVINGKVYYGGGSTDVKDTPYTEYLVYCYDPSQDKWTTLPSLPVRWFSLGQVNGKLVTVGGWKRSIGNATNDIYTYYDDSQTWKQTVASM